MPNPIQNRAYYTDVLIGGRPMPGFIIDGGIKGLKSAEEWMKLNGIQNIEALVWKKRPLIKGISVTICMTGETDEQTIAYYADWYPFISFLKPGGNPNAKPPAYGVTNTQFKGAFVKQVVYAGHEEPIFSLMKPILATVFFDEYRKSQPLPVGAPEPAKINDTNPVPKSVAEAKFVAALDRAKKKNPQ